MNPELPFTSLSLGCAQLGSLYRAVTDQEARATLDAAWELGIRYFDTAPHYGLGLSERRVGQALQERPRGDFVLSTKVGRLLEPVDDVIGEDDEGFAVPATQRRVWDFSREGVLRSLEASLDRLGLDRVDVLFLHDPDDHYREALEGAYPALHELRDQGVVGAIGAGMNQAGMLADFARNTDMDLLMLAGRYTLLQQEALDDLLPTCEQRGISIVAAGVFNSGLLAIGLRVEIVCGLRGPEVDDLARRDAAGDERVARGDVLDLLAIVAARDDDAAGTRNAPSRDHEATGAVVPLQPGDVFAHERVDLFDRLDVVEEQDEHRRPTVPAMPDRRVATPT